jgi:hypothetical protein
MRRRVQVIAGMGTPEAPAPVTPAPAPAPQVEADGADSVIPSVPRAPRRGRGSVKLSKLEVAVQNAERRAKDGDWSEVDGAMLVGLYAVCHRLVYGVLPLELEKVPEFRRAAGVAMTMLQQHFEGEAGAMVEFVKWAWVIEKERHEWAGRQVPVAKRKRLLWQFLFTERTLTDYRISIKTRKRG